MTTEELDALRDKLELIEGRLLLVEGNMGWLAKAVLKAAEASDKTAQKKEDSSKWIV